MLNVISSRSVATGRLLASLMLASVLAVAVSAHAQQAAGDPPGRAARLADVRGQVWLYNTVDNEWTAVGRNQPLTTGDRIAVDDSARAEVSLGTTTLRLGASSEIEVVRLDDSRFVVRLASGSVGVRVRSAPGAAEFELDTDEGRFLTQAVGRYRFDRLDAASDATVFAGRAVFENRNTALPIAAGQHAQFWLDGSGAPQYSMVPPTRDEFAVWNDERDRAEDRVAAPRYVSADMTGAEDLDRYGQWEDSPEYGALWIPAQVDRDWAPYRVGHWAWVRPWGWTWVDDAPWGFAPFHYGRWVRHREVWAWAPGRFVARPVYAPALVAWFGGGRGSVSVGIGGGGPVGWVPLAPREVYVPSYRASAGYVRNVNFTHVNNVVEINNFFNNRNGEYERHEYRNRAFPGAVTVVPAGVFAGRQPVGPAAQRFRGDPQVRQLLADGRPTAALTPPVPQPPASARPADGRPPRPPFEGRAPGTAGGRPFGAPPATGAAPQAGMRPTPGTAPTAAGPAQPQPGRGPLAAQPQQPSTTPPTAGLPGAREPRLPSRERLGSEGDLVNRPQGRGPNDRPATADTNGARNVGSPAPAPAIDPVRPAPPRSGDAPREGFRSAGPGRGSQQSNAPAGPTPTTAPATTPVPGAAPVERSRDQGRGQRQNDTPRSNDAPRPADAARPAEAPRPTPAAEPRGARPEPAPRAGVPAEARPARVEPRAEAPRSEAPKTEAPKSEAPRGREERRDDKRDPNERVR